ncbi:MAG: hypothetical protein H0U46_03550, partial [Actinobacteria bacterium]|nr:hypothetical protein [Actinomycetota bacterium]
MLLAAVTARLDASSAFSQPAGWAQIRRDDCSGPLRTDLSQAFFYKVVSGSEPSSYVFSFPASTGAAGTVLAYTGVSSSAPVIASTGRYTRNSVVTHGPAVTASAEGGRVIGFFGHSGAEGVSAPSGMTQRTTTYVSDGSTVTLSSADEALASSASSGNKAARSARQQSCNLGGLILLRPGGSDPSPPPPPP